MLSTMPGIYEVLLKIVVWISFIGPLFSCLLSNNKLTEAMTIIIEKEKKEKLE